MVYMDSMKSTTVQGWFFLAWLGFWLTSGCTPAEEEITPEPLLEEPAPPIPGDMVLIPAGEFIMGHQLERPGQRALEAPEREMTLPAYYIDAYEVTNGQWIKFLTETSYKPEGNWREFYTIGKEDYPVSNVTWNDAKEHCKWRGGRLPTEAEWEKAARGPEAFPYPWGEKWDPTKSNCNETGYKNIVEVGHFIWDKSAYSVYDMMGNIQEWTDDKLKPYPKSLLARDEVFRYGHIVARGASYAFKGSSMFLWTRSGYPAKAQYGLGFRCYKDAEEIPAETPSKLR